MLKGIGIQSAILYGHPVGPKSVGEPFKHTLVKTEYGNLTQI